MKNGYQPKTDTSYPPPTHGSNIRKTPLAVNIKITSEKTLEELAKEITERGNDMQVTHSKNGLKVFEVSKKLVKEISG